LCIIIIIIIIIIISSSSSSSSKFMKIQVLQIVILYIQFRAVLEG
jgi:hypothetical protein